MVTVYLIRIEKLLIANNLILVYAMRDILGL